MARITKEEVLKIAYISRISLHEEEIDALTAQLEAVLEYAARIHEVAATPLGGMPIAINRFRPDQIIPCDPEPILKEAPQVESHYFVVPAILEHE